tara:strand:- start:534 stop:1106 length:573 start_codon:yes stop_codon:yes gene_type:complete
MNPNSLECILKEKGHLVEDAEGNNSIKNPECAWDIYLDYLSNTGAINRGIIKSYRFLKTHKMPKSVDWFLQAYIGGSMTRSDQEMLAIIAQRDPQKLTIINSIINIAISFQYYGMVKGAGAMGSLFTKLPEENIDTIGYSLAGFIASANLTRITASLKTKKAYAGISLDSLIINTPTYIKKIKKSNKVSL